ncbi:zinc finger protein with KRAB and SCAN domains 3-like [Anopheles marshallii]|uniref:zinc finger protein with KRAB and SCAN domains 3-like n=1 Tax=Anopheles marshallii TaxID=1521116 RepID=UPI00237ADB8C|nr:zinc finger protein with KRAB and SCAN domains 3-like [Anopheles marshallii]
MSSKDECTFEITITNFSTCCRLCLSCNESDRYLDISKTTLDSDNDITLKEAMEKVTNNEILVTSKLPSKLCKLCSARVDDAYCFIQDFHRTNELLLNYLDNEALETVAEEHNNPDSCDSTESDEIHMEIEQELEEQLVEESETNDRSEDEKRALTAVEIVLQQIGMKASDPKPRAEQRTATVHLCNVCDKSFLRRSNLVDHLRLHAQVKMYECDYCDKSFVQSGNLKSHLRTHTAEKPFECNICGKAFTQSSSMKTHMLTHTNVKPFACDVCEKGFTSSSDLNKHKRTHSGIKPYQCIICANRLFTQKVHLRNHLARMHPTSNITEALKLGVVT